MNRAQGRKRATVRAHTSGDDVLVCVGSNQPKHLKQFESARFYESRVLLGVVWDKETNRSRIWKALGTTRRSGAPFCTSGAILLPPGCLDFDLGRSLLPVALIGVGTGLLTLSRPGSWLYARKFSTQGANNHTG